MTTTMMSNGRLRKSLADQIDRLDAILDGLADGLNEAVATAVKDAVMLAVKEAVQAILKEILTNPELVARFGLGSSSTGTKARASTVTTTVAFWTRRLLGLAFDWAWLGFRCIQQASAIHRRSLHARLHDVWQQLRGLGQFKRPLLIAGGVGLAVAVAAYFAGPWLASTAGGFGTFAATLAIEAELLRRRALKAAATANRGI
jgi:hypothetical protein